MSCNTLTGVYLEQALSKEEKEGNLGDVVVVVNVQFND